ncbi:MAG: hypothetical protein ABIN55_07850 [Aeromicrobium sp.]
MTRRTTTGWMTALGLSLILALTGCGSDDAPETPKPKTTADAAVADKAAVLDAFSRFWAESVVIANSGKVPKDALQTNATGSLREQELAQLNEDAKRGTTRTGAPKFKDQTVTLSGDTALVVTCVNTDEWVFVLKDGRKLAGKAGWRQLGRELTKVDGKWLVTGSSPASTKDTCP